MFSYCIILHFLLKFLGKVKDNNIPCLFFNHFLGKIRNFAKYSANQLTSFGVPYDYSSIMHYSKFAFSKNGKPTIIPKVG